MSNDKILPSEVPDDQSPKTDEPREFLEREKGVLVERAHGGAFINMRIQSMFAEAAILAAQYEVTAQRFAEMAGEAHAEWSRRLSLERALLLGDLQMAQAK